MADRINTVFVTDVSFWDRQTGAQNRIAQLTDALNASPFRSSALITQLSVETDWNQVEDRSKIPVSKIDLSVPPEQGVWERIKWEFSAIAHWLGWQKNSHRSTFDNYYPPQLVRRFRNRIVANPPEIIVFEYATQTQLLRALPASIRKRIVCVLDSHDVLWKRSQQFEQQGEDHWVSVSQTEEEAAVREYDLILAIQSREAEYFEDVVGPDRVIVTSMEFEPAAKNLSTQPTNDIAIGYLASNNWANIDAAKLILGGWPQLLKQVPNAKLVLAGSVCMAEEIRNQANQLNRTQLLGMVNSVDDFYRQIDLVWNPIRFGTGLKIKNIEALAHAKCLVTTEHGAEGLFPDVRSETEFDKTGIGIIAPTEIPGGLINGRDVHFIRHLGSQGLKHIEKYFGLGTHYPYLRQKLRSLLSEKSG